MPSVENPRGPARRSPVFYNPAMAVDRDLAVAVLSAWGISQGGLLEGWEALAATGVRGLRILNETGSFRRMVLTELGPLAYAVLMENVSPYRGRGGEAAEHDARRALSPGRFDFVDVDPYGTPVPFLPAAVASLRPGGMLGIAATDMPVLAGVEPGAAERRYGGTPVRGRLGPEGGLRLLLAYVSRQVEPAGLGVRPLLSYVHDHHVRAYLELEKTNGRAPPVGRVDSAAWEGPPLGSKPRYGPLWLGPLFDKALVGRLEPPPGAQQPQLVARYIRRFQEEIEADRPFYYEPNELARCLALEGPPSLGHLVDGLRESGWKAGRTHARESGFRTDAPRVAVEALARALARPRDR